MVSHLNEDKLVQKKKINIELDVDTNVHDSSKNRYQGLIDLAKAIDTLALHSPEAHSLRQADLRHLIFPCPCR